MVSDLKADKHKQDKLAAALVRVAARVLAARAVAVDSLAVDRVSSDLGELRARVTRATSSAIRLVAKR